MAQTHTNSLMAKKCAAENLLLTNFVKVFKREMLNEQYNILRYCDTIRQSLFFLSAVHSQWSLFFKFWAQFTFYVFWLTIAVDITISCCIRNTTKQVEL